MNKTILISNIILALLLYWGNGLLGQLKSNSKGLFNYASFSFDRISTANFADHFFKKSFILHF